MHTVTAVTRSATSALFGFSVSTQLTRLYDMSYSQLMGALHKNGIEINRKVLADLAVNNADAFKAIVEGKVKTLDRGNDSPLFR